jgi:hypothetical protein
VAYNDYLINSGHFTWLKDIQYFEDDYGIERSVFFKDANTSNLQNIITLSSIISSDDNISKLNDLKNLEHLDLHLQSNNVGDLNWNLNFLKSIKSDKIVSLKLTFNGNDSFLMPDENGTLVQYKGKSYSFNDNNGSRIINVVDELNNESNLTVDDFDTYTRVDYFNLEGISHFKNLKTLHLHQSWQVRDFSPISTLSNLSNLFIGVDSEALGVDPRSPNRSFRQAKNIDKILDDLPNLKYLQIEDFGFYYETTYFDAEYLLGLKNLETLIIGLPHDFANNVTMKADEFANILSMLPSLKNLQLESRNFYVSDSLNLDDSLYLKGYLDPEKYFNYTLPHINFSILDNYEIKIPFP